MMSHPRMEMSNDAFGCSRATQVCMEDLILTEFIQVEGMNEATFLVKALDG